MASGRFVVLLAAVAITVSACTSDPAPEQAPAPVPGPVSEWDSVHVAVNAASTDMPGADSRRDIDAIAAEGFDGVRLLVKWSDVEPAEGHFDWEETDSRIDAAAARGLPILGVLTWAPTWAVPADYALTAHPAPASAERFAQFAHAAASRYRDRVTAWEVWNEPNVAASFGPSADPERYCSILTRTSRAIRDASPGALVITGPTSPAVDSANSVSPATFVEALYRCAGAATFDAVAMHPYSTPNLLSEPDTTAPNARWASANEIAAVKDVMDRYGDGSKRIWFTEFGAPTSAVAPGVSDGRQAEILVDGIEALRRLPYAGPVFVFDFRDSLTGSPIPDYNYGLVRSDYTPKPALAAVRNLPR